MRHTLLVAVITLMAVFIAAGTIKRNPKNPDTPDGAVHGMLNEARQRNWDGAFQYVANAGNVNRADFTGDLAGRNGSLRTYSNLEKIDTSVLRSSVSEAFVRTTLTYSSAVGAIADTLDLRVVKEGDAWKVVWPVREHAKIPPQVVPVNYLRWDVIQRGVDDDWGAQNVDPPKVRIVSMNATERDGSTVILGEIVNDDTVPGFVSVNATLVGKDGTVLGEETSFDKMSHTLLPKEISPFRIDFPGMKLDVVRSVRMTPTSMLVSASADPVIGVLHQRFGVDSRGKHVLNGELINQSGQVVNIPHVIATFYDKSGKVLWVADSYVDDALVPMTPEPFSVSLRDDIAANVQSYRVIVNQFSLDKR